MVADGRGKWADGRGRASKLTCSQSEIRSGMTDELSGLVPRKRRIQTGVTDFLPCFLHSADCVTHVTT